ncbi:MAG: ATP-binding protein [Microvirga sp.]
MAERSACGMVVIDRTGIIRSFDAAAARMFGYEPDEVIGRGVSVLIPSPDLETHDAFVRRCERAAEESASGPSRALLGLRKDGSVFPIEFHVGAFERGDAALYAGFVRDLTRQHELEARLQELQTEIYHLSRFTTVGEMASTLAHEINQPLTAIASYLKGVRRVLDRDGAGLSDSIRTAVDEAADQALRAGEVIRQLRAFVARGERERTIESLQVLIGDVSAIALVGCRERDIRVRFDLEDEPMLVVVNREQIDQVFLSLIRNAVEAMQESDTRVLTIGARTQRGSRMVEVTIDDTGPGIAQPVLERLFQPFNTTKPDQMGVGLSICRTIIEAHGGEIGAESRPRHGTTIRFSLRTVRTTDVV